LLNRARQTRGRAALWRAMSGSILQLRFPYSSNYNSQCTHLSNNRRHKEVWPLPTKGRQPSLSQLTLMVSK
jgi:hypothetical protein